MFLVQFQIKLIIYFILKVNWDTVTPLNCWFYGRVPLLSVLLFNHFFNRSIISEISMLCISRLFYQS